MGTHCNQLLRFSIATGLIVLLAACAGTTSIQGTHPRLANSTSTEKARVYFVRPNAGFSGVMDRPLTIILDGTELLSLAKGQYTLLELTTGMADLEVESMTVSGASNTMMKASTRSEIDLQSGQTNYLVFEMVSRGGLSGSVFQSRLVSKDQALDMVQDLVAMGLATTDPIR